MVRFAPCLAAAALLATGCGGGPSAVPDVGGDCLAAVGWNGVEYLGVATDPPRIGKRLGTAIVPPCGADEVERTVTARRIPGVHPSIAFVVPGPESDYPDSRLVWLGPGYPAASPRHPYHEAALVAVGGPDGSDRYRCEGERVIETRVRSTPAAADGYVEVTAADEATEAYLTADGVAGLVTLDARSRITGFDRHGVPFIEAGDELELTVRECVGREDVPGLAGLRRILVESLRPARAP